MLLSCNVTSIKIDKQFMEKEIIDKVNTNGYYIATYNKNFQKNDYFENENIILFKLDKDGFCNLFDISVKKNESIEITIENILKRNTSKTPAENGIYKINGNKIYIEYYIFNNPNHLFGKYIPIKYEGQILDKEHILIKTNKDNSLKFKFIQYNDISFKNYFRENNK